MTKAKPRQDSLAPAALQARAATGRTLIPPPTKKPPEEAAAAFVAIEPELVATLKDAVVTRRVDAAAAAGKARNLAEGIHEDSELMARFRSVADTKEFDMRSLERLGTYGLALWYAAYMQGTTAPKGKTQLPPATKKKATLLRARMQKLARYHFEAHEAEGPTVKNIVALRKDRGLAKALLGLADLYVRRHEIVSSDKTNYGATDEATARELSAELLDLLDADKSKWAARTAQAYTLLLNAYVDVQKTGLWMFRATPEEAARRFPSLVAESRAAVKRPRPKTVVAAGSTVTETPGATPQSGSLAKQKRRRAR